MVNKLIQIMIILYTANVYVLPQNLYSMSNVTYPTEDLKKRLVVHMAN
jgi:hypothetical protein